MAEKRLIDADKLYEELEEIRMDYIDEDSMSSKFAADVIETVQDEYLRKSPTVDAVEVVRCKDCKWYMPGELFTDIMFCHRLKKENGKPAKYNFCEDDFCSYGEKRTDGKMESVGV